MKLFLSSLGIPDPQVLTDLVDSKGPMKVGSVRDAWASYSPERQKEFDGYARAQLQSINAEHAGIYLSEHYDNPSGLMDALEKFDLIWIHGGNTFVLNYSIRKSGFEGVIKELLEKGVVFGGDSAGAVIAGPSLHGIELADDPNEAPEAYYDGLGLVDFGIIPHWGNEKYSRTMLDAEKEMKEYVENVVRLTDENYIVVNGESIDIK